MDIKYSESKRINYFLFFLFSIGGHLPLLAQNLVPNGDLEQFTLFSGRGTIPPTATYGPLFTHAQYWVNPLSGDAEYYQVGINAPATWCCGTRTAHSGKGFKGIDTWGFGGGEHVEAKLIQPLVAGKEYFVSFWLAQSTHYPVSTDNFGAHFSNTYWTGTQPPATQNAVQQGFYPDTSWRMFHTIYTAAGGEEFITLGMVPVPWTVTPQPLPGTIGTRGYMFLDDICVYDISNPDNYTVHDSSFCINTYPAILGDTFITGIYKWNTGDTSATISVNTDGKYWRRTYLPCSYRVDTFTVKHPASLNDTLICNGDSVQINLGNPDNNLSIQNGDFNSLNNKPWANPKVTTTYLLNGSCVNRDIFIITVQDKPEIDLGPDTFICNTSSFGLQVPEESTWSYLWQDGSASHTYTVLMSSNYWIKVTDPFGCSSSDTIQVYLSNLSQDLGADILFCNNENIRMQLKANVPANAQALWSTGSNLTSIQVQDTGTYWVIVKDVICTGEDTIVIGKEFCECEPNVPTAFSPNGDGLNDVFLPVIESGCPVKQFSMNIYNRFGERIYHSPQATQGWDGTYKGVPAELGVYFYDLRYEGGSRKKIYYHKGEITLVR